MNLACCSASWMLASEIRSKTALPGPTLWPAIVSGAGEGVAVGTAPGFVGSAVIPPNSPALTVGVIDSGIDYTHPDLAANVWSAPAPFSPPRTPLGGLMQPSLT